MAPVEMPKAARSQYQPEIGATGEFMMQGQLWNISDINPKFRMGQSYDIYENMRCDGEVAGGAARLTYPIRSANWSVEPPEGEDAAKHEPTLLAKQELFRERPQPVGSLTFGDILSHACDMLIYGMTCIEVVWETVDGRQVWKKLAPRASRTIERFDFDDTGDLIGAVQLATHPDGVMRRVLIPAEKLGMFVFGRQGSNLFGRAIIRPAYGHWFLKKLLMEVDAIRHERSGVGVAWVEIDAVAFGTVSDDQKAYFENVVRQLRTHQNQGVYMPPGCKLHVDYPTGSPSDIIGSLDFHNQQISRAMLTEFMATGTAQTGSRAVVASKMDLMMLTMQSVGNTIEDELNRLIRQLVDRNFGPQDEYPRAQMERLDKMTGTQKAEIMKLLADADLLRSDKPLRAQIREELDAPPEDEATLEVPLPPAPVPAPNGNGNTPAPPPSSNGQPRKPVNRVQAALAIPERILRRAPLPHETGVAFADINKYLNEEPLRVWHRSISGIRSDQIARIAQHAANASDATLAQGQLIRPGEKKMATELARALADVYVEGRKSVHREVRNDVPPPPGSVKMAGPYRKIDTSAASYADEQDIENAIEEETQGEEDYAPSPKQRAWLGRLAEGYVAGSTLLLVGAAVRAAIFARQAGLSSAEVERRVLSALDALSVSRSQAELQGYITTAFTTGRNDQGVKMRDEIGAEYYSAIMDDGTCEVCASMDGMEQTPGEDKFTTPNPDCEWPPNCRCVTIFVSKQAQEAA